MYHTCVPSFKLMYVAPDGSDKEMEYNILEIEHDQHGKYVGYQAMEGELSFMSLDHLQKFKYMPDQFRALHYQIMCANSDMIFLKEEIGKALERIEDTLLDELINRNSSFKKIPIQDD
ncbi:hypothetical protein POM88_021355 [Heracleum sosnowskyi]|uniref:Uncharacterized protein n=1 Tax=Heracleum sosnowskyi TaxID=360622 RepID=A0AAD8IGR1_9APIA|nr:hypothetical protein POM88_021355 [Heracleum sosnowskyi]